jgi:hypothetical protein
METTIVIITQYYCVRNGNPSYCLERQQEVDFCLIQNCENPFIDQIHLLLEEEVDLSEYRNFAEAYEQIGRFLDEVYSRKRIHSSLGYLTPSEYEMQWKEQQGRECDIKKKSP